MLHFIKAGVLTTVQDLGRFAYQNLGINPSGAMDKMAARLLNILLRNDENEGVIEMHFPAAEIHFECDALIAVGGADFFATVSTQNTDNQPLSNWKPHFIKAGSRLKFKIKILGARCYLAIKGGYEIENWLGSKSTNLAANAGGKLIKNGDKIGVKNTPKIDEKPVNFSLSPTQIPAYSSNPIIRFIAGNEFKNLTSKSTQLIDNEPFMIANNSNRMGYRLVGKPLFLNPPTTQLLSSAVSFGTIQLLPDGQLIVLMADHQTTGGYPRIGHIISEDLPILAQLTTNDFIKFQQVSLETAESLLISRENEIRKLKIGVYFKIWK